MSGMTRFYYLDREGRELGSIDALSFKDAHAWLGHYGLSYHQVTKFKPNTKKRRARRIEKRTQFAFQI